MIRIGEISPKTGPSEKMGIGHFNTIKMVIDNVNNIDGGIYNYKIDLMSFDDKAIPTLSAEGVNFLVSENVIAVLGPCNSSCAYEAMKMAKKCNIPLISSLATASNLRSTDIDNDWFLRSTIPDSRRAREFVKYISQNYGALRLIILYELDGEYGYATGLMKDFCKEFETLNIYYQTIGYSTDMSKLNKEISQIEKYSPDGILYLGLSKNTVWIARRIRSAGIEAHFFTMGTNTNLLEHEAMLGTTVIADVNPKDSVQSIKHLLQRYAYIYPGLRDPSTTAFDAINVLIQAISKLFRDSNTIKKCMNNISLFRKEIKNILYNETFEGLSGNIAFDRKGEVIGGPQLPIMKIEKGNQGLEFSPVTETKIKEPEEVYKKDKKRRKVLTNFILFVSISLFALVFVYLFNSYILKEKDPLRMIMVLVLTILLIMIGAFYLGKLSQKNMVKIIIGLLPKIRLGKKDNNHH